MLEYCYLTFPNIALVFDTTVGYDFRDDELRIMLETDQIVVFVILFEHDARFRQCVLALPRERRLPWGDMIRKWLRQHGQVRGNVLASPE